MTPLAVPPTRAGTPPGYAWRPVGAVAVALAAVLLAMASRYGYHRDELYFLAAGRRLAWGYDDQPPLVPALARLVDEVAPGSLLALRTPTALLAAATVLLIAATARELGGDRPAQLIAAVAAAVAPVLVFTAHTLSTPAVELALAALFTWLLARWLRTRADRLLAAAGVVAGLALLTKATFAFLLFTVLLGVLLAGPREVFRRPALWAGAALALALWAPYLWWQAGHGWPQLEMADVIRAEEPGGGRILLLPMQIVLLGAPVAAVGVAGLWRLLRNPRARPFRCLGWASLLLVVTYLVTGGQIYYPAAGHPAIIAAGGVATAGWLVRGDARLRRLAWRAAAGLAAVMTVAVGLPVYPATAIADSPQPALFPDTVETVGWPELVATVASVHASLPAAERATAVVFTANYGQAGAIERYGPEYGLPAVYSGHNGFWRWGPPPEPATGPVIVVGEFGEAYLRQRCGSVRLAARHDNGLDLDNEEQGVPVRLCRDLTAGWSALWPGLRHLD